MRKWQAPGSHIFIVRGWIWRESHWIGCIWACFSTHLWMVWRQQKNNNGSNNGSISLIWWAMFCTLGTTSVSNLCTDWRMISLMINAIHKVYVFEFEDKSHLEKPCPLITLSCPLLLIPRPDTCLSWSKMRAWECTTLKLTLEFLLINLPASNTNGPCKSCNIWRIWW